MVALIGIDCATQPNKVGLALGEHDGEVVRIRACLTGSPKHQPAAIVSHWLEQANTALLALDAPLGWPLALGKALAAHQAGDGMGAVAHALFRRQSDDDIHQRFGKRPLEVGANFISRTAVAALQLLDELRARSGASIPLAWSPEDLSPFAAIEVDSRRKNPVSDPTHDVLAPLGDAQRAHAKPIPRSLAPLHNEQASC